MRKYLMLAVVLVVAGCNSSNEEAERLRSESEELGRLLEKDEATMKNLSNELDTLGSELRRMQETQDFSRKSEWERELRAFEKRGKEVGERIKKHERRLAAIKDRLKKIGGG